MKHYKDNTYPIIMMAKLLHVSVSQFYDGSSEEGDNAPIENLWSTLKNELVHHRHYKTKEEAKSDISKYIKIFYNQQRLQKGSDFKILTDITQQPFLKWKFQNRLLSKILDKASPSMPSDLSDDLVSLV